MPIKLHQVDVERMARETGLSPTTIKLSFKGPEENTHLNSILHLEGAEQEFKAFKRARSYYRKHLILMHWINECKNIGEMRTLWEVARNHLDNSYAFNLKGRFIARYRELVKTFISNAWLLEDLVDLSNMTVGDCFTSDLQLLRVRQMKKIVEKSKDFNVAMYVFLNTSDVGTAYNPFLHMAVNFGTPAQLKELFSLPSNPCSIRSMLDPTNETHRFAVQKAAESYRKA